MPFDFRRCEVGRGGILSNRMKYGGNPDIRVYRSALQALSQSDFGARLVIDRVFIEAMRDGEVDLYCWEALVAAYVTRGDGPQVLRCAKEMEQIEGRMSVFGKEALEKVGMSDLVGQRRKFGAGTMEEIHLSA
jgi:hypothetical protein